MLLLRLQTDERRQWLFQTVPFFAGRKVLWRANHGMKLLKEPWSESTVDNNRANLCRLRYSRCPIFIGYSTEKSCHCCLIQNWGKLIIFSFLTNHPTSWDITQFQNLGKLHLHIFRHTNATLIPPTKIHSFFKIKFLLWTIRTSGLMTLLNPTFSTSKLYNTR